MLQVTLAPWAPSVDGLCGHARCTLQVLLLTLVSNIAGIEMRLCRRNRGGSQPASNRGVRQGINRGSVPLPRPLENRHIIPPLTALLFQRLCMQVDRWRTRVSARCEPGASQLGAHPQFNAVPGRLYRDSAPDPVAELKSRGKMEQGNMRYYRSGVRLLRRAAFP